MFHNQRASRRDNETPLADSIQAMIEDLRDEAGDLENEAEGQDDSRINFQSSETLTERAAELRGSADRLEQILATHAPAPNSPAPQTDWVFKESLWSLYPTRFLFFIPASHVLRGSVVEATLLGVTRAHARHRARKKSIELRHAQEHQASS